MPRGSSVALLALAGLASACSDSAVPVGVPQPVGIVLQRCDALGSMLPDQLGGLDSHATQPKSLLTHAWGSPAVTLRCGVAKPSGYHPRSTSTVGVDDVDWFEAVAPDAVTWTAVLPRPIASELIYVSVTVPTHYAAGEAFLTGLAAPLKQALR